MEVIFLGTGASLGVPVISCNCEVCSSEDPRDRRLRSSIIVKDDDLRILIDVSPDFREQILKFYDDKKKFDAVLLTHAHRDHVGGLDDLRPFIFFYDNKPIELFAEKETLEAVKLLFYYSFVEERYPGAPVFNLNTIDENPFYIKNTPIIPIRVFHGKLPILGFRIKQLTYITDGFYIPLQEFEKIKGTKILIINALREKPHYSHFNLSQALKIIEKVKPQKAFITHISHGLGKFEKISSSLPKNVFLAYDGLKIKF